eukprot:4366650-Pleurochrysis_carterae.AAC.1
MRTSSGQSERAPSAPEMSRSLRFRSAVTSNSSPSSSLYTMRSTAGLAGSALLARCAAAAARSASTADLRRYENGPCSRWSATLFRSRLSSRDRIG